MLDHLKHEEREKKQSFKNNPFVKFSTCHNYPQNATHSICFITTYRKFNEAILNTLKKLAECDKNKMKSIYSI